MSRSQTDEEFTVAVSDVTVDKRLNTDDYPTPAVEFELESARSDLATVRLVDALPAEAGPEDLGFHPDQGADHWHLDADELVFEYDLRPDQTVSTLYAIRGDEPAVEPFLTEPRSVDVEPIPEANADEASLEAEIPDIEADEESTDDDVASAVSADGSPSRDPVPMLSEEVGRESYDETRDPETAEPVPDADLGEDVVTAFVAAIRRDRVADDQLGVLRDALQPPAGSVDARIEQLQSEVTDLRAYTGALETFLDEEGPADQLVTDVQAHLESLDADLQTVQSRVSATEDQLESVAESTATVESDVHHLQADLADVAESLDRLEAGFETLDDQLPEADVGAELDELRADIETVKAFQETVQTAFGGTIDGDGDRDAA